MGLHRSVLTTITDDYYFMTTIALANPRRLIITFKVLLRFALGASTHQFARIPFADPLFLTVTQRVFVKHG